MSYLDDKQREAEKQSPAMLLIDHVWHHNREATGHSRTRLNGSMSAAVNLAIEAGMRFNRDDFTKIAAMMRVEYWSGEDSGERWYRLAIEMNNASAYQSYEAWRNRRPFILDGQRLHVGSEISWKAKNDKAPERWTITSFADDQSYATAVQYDYPKDERGYHRTKIKRRTSITREDIYERNKPINAAKRAARQAEGTGWFKVLMGGRSFHGGDMQWSLPSEAGPGEWHKLDGDLELCGNGLHITRLPSLWWEPGADVYEVQVGPNDRLTGNEQKAAVLCCRLLRKLSPKELSDHGIRASAKNEAAA